LHCSHLEVAATPNSSLNINNGNRRWHHCSSDNDGKKKESFEKKVHNISKGTGRWNIFFEWGSWVSRVGPRVQKKHLLKGGPKKKSMPQPL